MNSHIIVKMPPPFMIGDEINPTFLVTCIVSDDASRHLQFNMELSKSCILNKEELYNLQNWLAWATSWVADRN